MRTLALTVAAMGSVLLACAPQPETPEQEQARLAEESTAARVAAVDLLARWARYTSAGLADSLSLLFTDDVHLQPPNTAAVDGREAAQSFFGMMTGAGTFAVDTRVTAVEASGPLAYVAGIYTVAFTPSADLPGARATADTGKYLAVLRRVGSDWRIAAQSWNTDLRIGTPMTTGK